MQRKRMLGSKSDAEEEEKEARACITVGSNTWQHGPWWVFLSCFVVCERARVCVRVCAQEREREREREMVCSVRAIIRDGP